MSVGDEVSAGSLGNEMDGMCFVAPDVGVGKKSEILIALDEFPTSVGDEESAELLDEAVEAPTSPLST